MLSARCHHRGLLLLAIGLCLRAGAQPGALDPSFANGGRFTIFDVTLKGMVVQPDQRILVAGSRLEADNDILLMRLLPDGGLDPSFGTNGLVVRDLAMSNDRVSTVRLQPDGRILVAGLSEHPYVARFNANGTLDSSFGAGGYAWMDHPGVYAEEYWAVGLQADGSVLLAGTKYLTADFGDVIVFHLFADGTVDESFGVGGSVTLDGAIADQLTALATLPDGNFLLMAAVEQPVGMNGGTEKAALLMRCHADGTLDQAFGVNGKAFARPHPDASFVQPTTLVVRPDGRALVGGLNDIYGILGVDAFLMRFATDGTLDATFGEGGITNLPALNAYPSEPVSLALRPDGGMAMNASDWVTIGDSLNARVFAFGENGALDPWFGNSGEVHLDLDEVRDAPRAIALQASGKILSASYDSYTNHCDIVRLGAQGPLALPEAPHMGALVLAPNPTEGLVRIPGDRGIAAVRVLDALGHVCPVRMPAAGILDLSSLMTGPYVVEIISTEGLSRGRVMKW